MLLLDPSSFLTSCVMRPQAWDWLYYFGDLYIHLFISGIPIAEKFSFCLHTLLSDIAVRCEDYRKEIIDTQVECMVSLTRQITNLEDSVINSASKLFLCRTTVPVLIGLARAMGRFSTGDTPLICRIFPKPEPPLSQAAATNQLAYKRSFSSFRNIIPRSLSGNLHTTVDILAVTAVSIQNLFLISYNKSLNIWKKIIH